MTNTELQILYDKKSFKTTNVSKMIKRYISYHEYNSETITIMIYILNKFLHQITKKYKNNGQYAYWEIKCKIKQFETILVNRNMDIKTINIEHDVISNKPNESNDSNKPNDSNDSNKPNDSNELNESNKIKYYTINAPHEICKKIVKLLGCYLHHFNSTIYQNCMYNLYIDIKDSCSITDPNDNLSILHEINRILKENVIKNKHNIEWFLYMQQFYYHKVRHNIINCNHTIVFEHNDELDILTDIDNSNLLFIPSYNKEDILIHIPQKLLHL